MRLDFTLTEEEFMINVISETCRDLEKTSVERINEIEEIIIEYREYQKNPKGE